VHIEAASVTLMPSKEALGSTPSIIYCLASRAAAPGSALAKEVKLGQGAEYINAMVPVTCGVAPGGAAKPIVITEA
jgi:hypothetical protein